MEDYNSTSAMQIAALRAGHAGGAMGAAAPMQGGQRTPISEADLARIKATMPPGAPMNAQQPSSALPPGAPMNAQQPSSALPPGAPMGANRGTPLSEADLEIVRQITRELNGR
tara:strand:+ start:14048 stop:14386 length:339 start_codon:yes stop_codon:yes gene_type:complete